MPDHDISQRLTMPAGDEVHVWFAQLAGLRSLLKEDGGILSAGERERAGKFFFDADRERYVLSHGLLRKVLGGYTGIPAAEVGFLTGPFGKPELDAGGGVPQLRFNLSHSGEAVAVAVTACVRVGMDVEHVRARTDVMELAAGQFAAEEAADLAGTAPDVRTEAFYRCWTRKEAYVKARGDGLGLPLKSFAVVFGLGEEPGIRRADDEPDAARRWTVLHLDLIPGYVAAAVAEGRGMRAVCRRWRG